MSYGSRADWSRHIDQVIRSRRYTWLAEGLGGEPLEPALVNITTDIMHICQREGVDWEALLRKSRANFEREEDEAKTSVAQ